MRKIFISLLLLPLSFNVISPIFGAGASLYLAPSRGTFLVGSTFSISIFVDTKGNKINALEVNLKFPPDILQVTTPTAGKSFISEWITPPSYSNIGGFINFKGGIPEGISTSAGLISTITFRAKSPGIAKVEILNSSKVLLADGKGTPIFTTNFGGEYQILVSPPEGPKIFSPSHSDPDKWYSDSNPSFFWEKEKGVTDFSYSFSQNPQEIPDTTSEGDKTFKFYENIQDGIWFFHLRARKNGLWGKTSHFSVKIDTTPPQEIIPKIDASTGFIYFETKDLYSGVEHYEISVFKDVPGEAPFFIEATSPFKIPFEKPGKYVVIIRAYDKAGNYRESESKFRIISPFISYIEHKGIQLKGIFISFGTFYSILIISLVITGYLIFHFLTKKKGFKKATKEIEEALKEIERIEEKEREARRLRREFEKQKKKFEEKLK